MNICVSAQPVDDLSRFYKAAGDPVRLQVLQILRQGAFGVMELCDILDLAQPRLSHHLKLLRTAGLVDTRKEGTSVFYRRALTGQQPCLDGIFTALDALPVSAGITAGIRRVHQQRTAQARDFFASQAGRLQDAQDLIAGFSAWSDLLDEYLERLDMPPTALALELGPGEGSALSRLCKRFARTIAIDISPEMIEQCRQRALAAQLENLELHQGELADLQPALPPVDFLLIGMVLHHLPEPAGFFQQAARTLADGGALLVIELARHEQHWAGPQCGDLWLGFDADELNQWASAAGLHPVYQRFAGLRTGFQIQTLAWKKGKNHE